MTGLFSNFKKRALGDPSVPRTDKEDGMNARYAKVALTISVYPLVEPARAWLLPGEPRLEERQRSGETART